MKKSALFLLVVSALGMCCASNQRHFPARTIVDQDYYLQSAVELKIRKGTDEYGCTGVIVDSTGLVATARHCVENADKVLVINKNMARPATVMGMDKTAELAVLSVRGWDFVPLPFCDEVVIDSGVCAIGRTHASDLFEFECGDVTAGNRELIITTTKIRPGFSGGPLISIDGECVVGISYAFYPFRAEQRSLHVGYGALKELVNKFR